MFSLLFQVTWVVVWLIFVPPDVVLDMPDMTEPRVERTCSQRMIEKIGTMVWDLCLVFVCCVYAFRTRKLPNNYKESRFIAFCVFSTLLVLLAFSPTIFTTREPFFRSVYSALGIIVIATVANLCLFVIKLYAIYYVSEKDLALATANGSLNDRGGGGGGGGSSSGDKQHALAANNNDPPTLSDQATDFSRQPNSISNQSAGVASRQASNGGAMTNEPLAAAGDINLGFETEEDPHGGVYHGKKAQTAT